MVDLIRVTGANQVGVKVRLEDGSFFVAPATVAINATGAEVMSGGGSGLTVDENGDVKVVQADTVDRGTLDLSQAGATMEMPIGKGQGVLGVDITGLSGSGATVVAESTVGLLWFPMNQLRVGAGGTIPMIATEDSSFRSSVVAKTRVRLRVTIAGSGTAQVSYSLSTNASLVQLSAAIPPGNNKLGSVDVANFPASFNVGNFPVTQAVSGTVSISGTVPVTGTFWQATQPISAVTLPLPIGAATAAKQDDIVAALGRRLTVDDYRLPNAAAAGAIVPKVATDVPAFIASAVPCNLFGGVVVGRADGSGAYVFFLNRTTIPASGSAIVMTEVLAMSGYSAGGGASIVPDQVPDRYSVGCVVIVSTSIDTYTPVTGVNRPKYIKVRVL